MQPKLAIVLAFLFPFLCLAQNSRPAQGPAPSWVTVLPISYNDTKLDDDAEDGYSNVDYEYQVSLQENAGYYKKAFRILTEAGVQNCSDVSVDFDPSYEKLIFHSIRVIREGVSINKLQLSKFSVIQQEKDRDRFIYDGTRTALLLLDDVRKGDIVEYSYTLKGFNPIFKNKFCTDLRLQFSVPVYRIYYKMIVPGGRNIKIENLNSDINPETSQTAGAKVYEWKLDNTRAFRTKNEEAPEWYDLSPYAMISEFDSWKEIVDWGRELFPAVTRLSAPLQQKINEINTSPTVEDKIGKALRFVQDDIRYLGIEMGINSHKPHTPNEVFAQRFGDCKDKSYLLCTMLRAMQIEAWPVMINTISKQNVQYWLPSPFAFDHVTTFVKANGRGYYFDPTISYQRGHINDISFPDYEMGLIISESSSELSKINNRNIGKTRVFEQFDMTGGTNEVKLKVRTIYSGTFADEARYDFHTNSRYEILKRYREFYDFYFEEIKSDSLYTADNPDGSFTTFESYTIPNFWQEKNGRKIISFKPYLVTAAIRRPKNKKSDTPFELKYPLSVYEEIKLKLPGGWEINGTEDRIDSKLFRFSSRFTTESDSSAVLVYSYENYKESIEPGEIEDYERSMTRVDEATVVDLSVDKNANNTFSKFKGTNKGSGFSYTWLYLAVLLCAAITYVIKKHKRA